MKKRSSTTEHGLQREACCVLTTDCPPLRMLRVMRVAQTQRDLDRRSCADDDERECCRREHQ